MEQYDESTYGEHIAEVYDNLYVHFDPAAVTTLAELAQGGRALELGIGTGRIALPLAARGVEVHGIDASPAMVAKLRAKPGGDKIEVTIGDFAALDTANNYSLIYVVFNTFFALTNQQDQIRCFRNVAAHLSARGLFVIEAFVPDLGRFDRGQSVRALNATTTEASLDISLHDAINQRVTGHHVVISSSGIKFYPIQIRYAWPSELDLMAQLAGMQLKERWGGWQRERFTNSTQKHISIYEKLTK